METNGFNNSKDELIFIKEQLIDLKERKAKHISETCKFFRYLSGENISRYAIKIKEVDPNRRK